ncbi:hypothetical protein Ahy_B03g066831 isoform B [Arachis hypogaea]|uniref:Uncharacterized protein n=1 Tax=Arachis hypogaea TaxID=3818 RepID=A0A445A4Z0_ARAHY|nr:hypothetical protein Ahy_B03g066831 isoform B [Arachis hypogaea]
MYKKGNYCVQRECSVEIWHELGFSQVAKHHEAQSSDRETWQRRSSYAVTEMEGGGRAVAVVSQRLVGRGELKNQNPIHHCEKGGAALTSLQPMRRTQKSSVASNTGGVNHSSSNYGIGVAGYGGLNGPGSSPINSAPTCRPEGASMELPVSRRLSPTKIGRPEERQRRSLRQEGWKTEVRMAEVSHGLEQRRRHRVNLAERRQDTAVSKSQRHEEDAIARNGVAKKNFGLAAAIEVESKIVDPRGGWGNGLGKGKLMGLGRVLFVGLDPCPKRKI